MGALYLLRNCKLFSNMFVPPAKKEAPVCSHPSPTLVICLFDYSHPRGEEVWDLIVILICLGLMADDIQYFFMCFLAICIASEKISIRVLCLLLNLVGFLVVVEFTNLSFNSYIPQAFIEHQCREALVQM